MDAMAEIFGMSKEEAHAGWVQQVMNDTTDWALCPTCAGKAARPTARAL